MKRLLTATFVLVAIGVSVLAQGSIEQALMDLERQWSKAALANNGAAVAPLLATDFISIQSDGTTQTRAMFLDVANKSKWQQIEVGELKVQVYGNSAVVTGIWTGKGTAGGRAFDGRERFADTWVKMPDGKWQCVLSIGVTLK